MLRNSILDKLALALIIVGALNWGCVGIFQVDLVAWLFGSSMSILARIVYTVIALCGIWAVSFFMKDDSVNMAK